MISTQLQQALTGFDEVMNQDEPDFGKSGLKISSVIRVARLAVMPADMFMGVIGEIGTDRLNRIRRTVVDWIQS
jgi:mRNA interferase MazF